MQFSSSSSPEIFLSSEPKLEDIQLKSRDVRYILVKKEMEV